jgi:hypothetical protein
MYFSDFRFDRCREYQDALKWYGSLREGFFIPTRDMELCLDYAKSRAEATRSLVDRAEDKADSLLKVVLAAVAVVATILRTTSSPGMDLFWLYASLISLAIAALFCIAARRPIPQPSPTNIDDILRFQMKMDDKGIREAQIAATLHVEAIGLCCVADYKAMLNDRATSFLTGAVLCALIALWPLVGPTHQSSQAPVGVPKHGLVAPRQVATPP